MNNYTTEDFLVWKTLFERQLLQLQNGGACEAYLHYLNEMNPVLNGAEIPNFDAINQWFEGYTGWKIEVVPGMIPVGDFFDLLAQKKFCSSTWLRSMEELDYLSEPDMFHDVFGHIPLLADPHYAAFTCNLGKLGQRFKNDPIRLKQLQRLYWYTIEFGVLKENNTFKSYGAGILSSFGEAQLIIKQQTDFKPFILGEVLNTSFENDVIQDFYFVIDDLADLTKILDDTAIRTARKVYV